MLMTKKERCAIWFPTYHQVPVCLTLLLMKLSNGLEKSFLWRLGNVWLCYAGGVVRSPRHRRFAIETF